MTDLPLSGVRNITAPSGPSILSQMTPSRVQYDEYCAGHLLSYRDGRQLEGTWFYKAQDPISDVELELAI